MKVFVIKYAMEKGIKEIEVMQNKNDPEIVIEYDGNYQIHYNKGEWYKTMSEAIKAVETLRMEKIASIGKQLQKIQNICFTADGKKITRKRRSTKKWLFFLPAETYGESSGVAIIDETGIDDVVNEESGFEPDDIKVIKNLKIFHSYKVIKNLEIFHSYEEEQITGYGLIVIRVDDNVIATNPLKIQKY